MDSFVPEPEREVDKPFLMPVEDVFTISGRGTVVTGRIEQGIVKTGDPLEIVGISDTTTTTCTGVEMFRCWCIIRGIERDDVERGQVLSAPGSINTTYRSLKLKYMYSVKKKVEDILHSLKVTDHNSTFRTTDVTGACALPEGTEMVMPGDNVKMKLL